MKKTNRTKDKSIHVSLDVDALDPKYVSSTGTPVPDGLTPDDIYKVIKIIFYFCHILRNILIPLQTFDYVQNLARLTT